MAHGTIMRIVRMLRIIAVGLMAMGICGRARLGDVYILRMRTTLTLVTTTGRVRFDPRGVLGQMLRRLATWQRFRMMQQFMQRPTQQRTEEKRRNNGDPDCVFLEGDLVEHLKEPVQYCASKPELIESMAAVLSYLKRLTRVRWKIRNRRKTCRQNTVSGRTPQLMESGKRNNRQNRHRHKSYRPHTPFQFHK